MAAGITGEVVGTGQVRPSKTTAWFQVVVPPEGPRLLLTALRCCQMLKANAEKEPERRGTFKAVVGRAPAGEVSTAPHACCLFNQSGQPYTF